MNRSLPLLLALAIACDPTGGSIQAAVDGAAGNGGVSPIPFLPAVDLL